MESLIPESQVIQHCSSEEDFSLFYLIITYFVGLSGSLNTPLNLDDAYTDWNIKIQDNIILQLHNYIKFHLFCIILYTVLGISTTLNLFLKLLYNKVFDKVLWVVHLHVM